jgi:urease accessory protein
VQLVVDRRDGTTRRRSVYESGSLRVRFPGQPSDELEAVLVNTAGGMTGGDTFGVDVEVGGDSRLLVTSTSAEKIYRSIGTPAKVTLRIDIARGGVLHWLPQETIMFDRAALSRRIDVTIAAGGRLVLVEPIVFGRIGMGETVEHGTLRDSWRVRLDGRLVYAEGVVLDGPIASILPDPAVARGGAAIATALIIPGDEAITSAIAAINDLFHGDVGASAWNGQAVLRFCARDGTALRHDLACALAILREGPLPRLWIN